MDDALHALKQTIAHQDTPEGRQPYETPERGAPGESRTVFFPKTTEEVQRIAECCYQHAIPMLPQGSRTGLVGGSTPDPKGSTPPVIISLERMNKVLDIDPLEGTAEVEAGVTIAALNEKAAEHGLFFPVKVAGGAPQIGGAAATNAGGGNFLLYGGVREQVLGLQVVLPHGEVLDTITHVKKNNTGPQAMYDFIGSEGAFGIITKVQLRLHRIPKQQKVAIFAVENTDKVMALFRYFKEHHNHELSAFEYMSGNAFAKGVENKQNPFDRTYTDYALAELVSHLDKESSAYRYDLEDVFAHVLEHVLDENAAMVLDGVAEKPETLWGLREGITESIKHTAKKEGASVVGNDVSVPVFQMPGFIQAASRAVTEVRQDVTFYLFGHVGDGNVHFNFTVAGQLSPEQRTALKKTVWEIVGEFGGSVSAEHGIGRHNIDAMALKNPVELALLERKKTLYDPKGVMNPGVLFVIQ